MADNEIIKALECCIAYITDCENCPYHIVGDGDCVNKTKADAIDLIKRQQAEIDRMNGWVNSLEELCERKTALLTDANWSLITTRAEAIKEFAEKLKANRPHLNTGEQVFYIRPEEVDNLVKEMVGDE